VIFNICGASNLTLNRTFLSPTSSGPPRLSPTHGRTFCTPLASGSSISAVTQLPYSTWLPSPAPLSPTETPPPVDGDHLLFDLYQPITLACKVPMPSPSMSTIPISPPSSLCLFTTPVNTCSYSDRNAELPPQPLHSYPLNLLISPPGSASSAMVTLPTPHRSASLPLLSDLLYTRHIDCTARHQTLPLP